MPVELKAVPWDEGLMTAEGLEGLRAVIFERGHDDNKPFILNVGMHNINIHKRDSMLQRSLPFLRQKSTKMKHLGHRFLTTNDHKKSNFKVPEQFFPLQQGEKEEECCEKMIRNYFEEESDIKGTYHADMEYQEAIECFSMDILNSGLLEIGCLTNLALGGIEMPGVTAPYGYVAQRYTGSGVHQEDKNLSSVNLNAGPGRKLWVFFRTDDSSKLINYLANFFDGPKFSNFYREKTILLDPLEMEKMGFKTYICTQNPGDAIIIPARLFHQVINIETCVTVASNHLLRKDILSSCCTEQCSCHWNKPNLDVVLLREYPNLYEEHRKGQLRVNIPGWEGLKLTVFNESEEKDWISIFKENLALENYETKVFNELKIRYRNPLAYHPVKLHLANIIVNGENVLVKCSVGEEEFKAALPKVFDKYVL